METALQKTYLESDKLNGSDKFYSKILYFGMTEISVQKNYFVADVLLTLSKAFLASYRRENDEDLLEISKIIRKAAHKLYRVLLKMELTSINAKFLNKVK